MLPNRLNCDPSFPPLVTPTVVGIRRAAAIARIFATVSGGVMLLLSTARSTAPVPSGMCAIRCGSTGESDDTNVSTAKT